MAYLGGIYAIGGVITLVSDVFRNLFFFFDSIIYSLIPIVYSLIYKLYDITSIFDETTLNNVLNNITTTVYSFLAIFMFFRVAFSLITMIVDPSVIDDKEKGAKKIVMNIMICLVLIVAVPVIFDYAKQIQSKILDEQLIEKVVIGDEFEEEDAYNLGNDLSLAILSVFIHPVDNATSDATVAYNNVFESKNNSIVTIQPHLSSVTGNPILSLIPIVNIMSESSHYSLSYVFILSTLVGGYVLWMFIKMMIDVAYRSIKFMALELLSPIAIVSYIDPGSSKKGVFSKWLNETFKTYVSLFIRIFVFAFASVLLRSFDMSAINGEGFFTYIFFILAIIAFIKTAPKFIDNLFGTSISKDSDTKFVSDMFRGIVGGTVMAGIGTISGATVAKRTGQSVVKGAFSGARTGFTKGYSSAKKGDMIGVVKSGFDTHSAEAKKYGYNVDVSYEKDLSAMERFVAVGKKAKTAAIMQADANDRKDIKDLFNKRGRNVNGYEVTYSNLIGDAEAEGLYKKYAATVAETSIIPGISQEGLNVYNNAAEKSLYASLSKIQASRANSAYETKYSAFVQRDASGREADVLEAFNYENARRASIGEQTYTSWQDMYRDIGGLEATANITLDDAYKIALENEIKLKTGHTTSEWANISAKESGDADGAKDEVKRHEASSRGQADKRRKKLYSEAKGKVEAQSNK